MRKMMMDEIKLLRLHCGTDIICDYLNIGNTCFIKNPMVVFMDYDNDDSNLIMRHWSPIEIISTNETILDVKDVLCVFDPTEEVVAFYHKVMAEEDDTESIDEILEKNTRIH